MLTTHSQQIQIYRTIFLTKISMLYIISSECIYVITESLYLRTDTPPDPQLQGLGCHHLFCVSRRLCFVSFLESTCKPLNASLSFSFWLTLLSIMLSHFSQEISQMAAFPYFVKLEKYIVYMHTPYILYFLFLLLCQHTRQALRPFLYLGYCESEEISLRS